MKSEKRYFLIFGILLLLLVTQVNALDLFGSNGVVDSITKSLQSMQIFYYDFMAFILDIFSILLFILWILLIFGIVYSVYFLISLPKQMGVKNYHEAIIKIAMLVWEFMI